MDYRIRLEEKKDWRKVEEITRAAFWNLYVPGCDEHYLVHIMRSHEDYIPELDFVIESDTGIIGNIMYTRARIITEMGHEKRVATFGPLSVHPDFQRRSLGKILVDHSLEESRKMGFGAVIIMGNPSNYVSMGFKSCLEYQIGLPGGIYPTALLVRELEPGFLESDSSWVYEESPVYNVDPQKAAEYDASFPALEKKELPSQELFRLLSRSIQSDQS